MTSDQIPEGQDPFGFSDDSFLDNPEPRCACLLLLDTSGSMRGEPISELNAGIATFKSQLDSDPLAAKRVEVGIVSFGPVKTVSSFTTASHFSPPELVASGETPMGEAIEAAIRMVTVRKSDYKAAGISYYRPWIFLITDGAPTDNWTEAAKLVKEGEQSGAFSFFAVAVKDARLDVLSQISVRSPVRLSGLKFNDLFIWLSKSLRSVSASQPGAAVSLAPPSGWTVV